MFASALALASVPAHAEWVKVGETYVVEELVDGEWVEVERGAFGTIDRFVAAEPLERSDSIAAYGPFRVLDEGRAALVGITDSESPASFAAMLRENPGIATLELVDAGGTFDDRANLQLGRMIRRAGIATHVPAYGSVRSGAVELFIAGTKRSIEDGARFAVHAWLDESGFEATDYAAGSPENSKYVSYSREMGLAQGQAEAFYDLTNSVPHADALWLSAGEMRSWIPTASEAVLAAPRLAYAATLDIDFTGALH